MNYTKVSFVHAIKVFVITNISYILFAFLAGIFMGLTANGPFANFSEEDQFMIIDSVVRFFVLIIFFITLRWSAKNLTELYNTQAVKIANLSTAAWVILMATTTFGLNGVTTTGSLGVIIGSIVFYSLTKKWISK